MAAGQVLVVSADERWLRVLEVTLRLGGAETISRRSAREALSLAGVDSLVSAIVLDLAQASPDELEVARGVLGHSALPAVVILPERLATQSELFAAAGATVLVRPYRPSELYAALRITDADGSSEAALAAAEAEPARESVAQAPVHESAGTATLPAAEAEPAREHVTQAPPPEPARVAEAAAVAETAAATDSELVREAPVPQPARESAPPDGEAAEPAAEAAAPLPLEPGGPSQPGPE